MNINKVLKISDLNHKILEDLVHQALALDARLQKAPKKSIKVSSKDKGPVGLIFFEPSTRTRVSFERACHLAGRPSILLQGTSSSFEKGETLEDALLNLKALGIRTFVIRCLETGALEALRKFKDFALINAGDGVGEHPTQALLDYVTLVKTFAKKKSGKLPLKGFRLGIVGDLRHSRVAQSWSSLADFAGVELRLISPSAWRPTTWGSKHAWTDNLSSEIKQLDAIMALRVQKERMGTGDSGVSTAELSRFQLTPALLNPKQRFLHPGPVNWGVELHEGLHSDPRSLILEQVACGLALRTTLISQLKS